VDASKAGGALEFGVPFAGATCCRPPWRQGERGSLSHAAQASPCACALRKAGPGVTAQATWLLDLKRAAGSRIPQHLEDKSTTAGGCFGRTAFRESSPTSAGGGRSATDRPCAGSGEALSRKPLRFRQWLCSPSLAPGYVDNGEERCSRSEYARRYHTQYADLFIKYRTRRALNTTKRRGTTSSREGHAISEEAAGRVRQVWLGAAR